MQKSIVINSLLVRFYIYPSKGIKTIVLLHGWRSEGAIWNSIAQKLHNDGYSVYALDLPGFGGSPAPKTPFTLSDYADIVSGFIKKMNLIKVNLIGHSFGGRVGIKLSAAKPELISRLVLVDSAGFADSGKQKVKLLAKLVKPLFAPKFMQGVRKWIYEKMGSEDYLATPELQKTFVNIIEEDLSSDLSCIQFPTLLIWGENDQDTPDSYGKRMQSIIRNSQFVILPNAGHFSFLDNPEGFYNAVSQFIH